MGPLGLKSHVQHEQEPRGDDEEIEGLGVQGRRAAIGA